MWSFEQWSIRLQEKRMGKGIRRFVICTFLFMMLVYLANAVLGLCLGRNAGRLFGWAAFVVSLTAMGMSVFWLRFIRKASLAGNDAPTWDERAQLDFGKPYLRLSARHKFDVRVRCNRQIQRDPAPPDERETALQREAERRALRVLRVCGPILSLTYWLVCLCLPGGPVRAGLLMGAVVISAIVIAIGSLPDIFRLWTEPGAAPEPTLLTLEREA